MSLQAEGADDYERKLTQLRREEELIHEEAREAAAVLRADMPTLRAGEVRCLKTLVPWARSMLRACLPRAALRASRQLTRRAGLCADRAAHDGGGGGGGGGARGDRGGHGGAPAARGRQRGGAHPQAGRCQGGAHAQGHQVGAASLQKGACTAALLHSIGFGSAGGREGLALGHLHLSQVSRCCHVLKCVNGSSLTVSLRMQALQPDSFVESMGTSGPGPAATTPGVCAGRPCHASLARFELVLSTS